MADDEAESYASSPVRMISIGPPIGPRQLETDPLKPLGCIEVFE
jgi:hypothetical protein